MRFIDLFGGIGGFSLGLERCKHECIGYYEWDKYAVEVYNKNFGTDYKPTDITGVDGKTVPDHEILCAGFPCQPFSIAGKRKGFKDIRGTLFAEIVRVAQEKRPIPDEMFKRHVYWVWSRKPEQISILDDAKAEIKQEATGLMEKYAESTLPIAHNGLRDVLLRLSTAHAALAHSTDESGEFIVVKKEHVTQAVAFYISVLDCLELEPYIESMAGKGKLTDHECASILKSLNKTHWSILDALKVQECSSPEIAAKLGVSDRTVKEHYDALRAHTLIETKPGKGAKLTKRGVMFLRLVISAPTLSELVKKSFTKSVDGEGKLHQFTNEGEEPLDVETIKPFASREEADP